MNVLFLTRYDVREFGVAEVLRGLASSLRPRGVNVIVASAHRSAAGAELPGAAACHHLRLPRPRWLGSGAGLGELIELCRQHRIDLVHCHGLYRPGHAARLLRRARGTPYVVTSHNIMPARRAGRRRVRRRCQRILQDASAVTCFNQVMAAHMRAFLDVDHKLWIIPNGLDLAAWRDDTAPADVPVVLGMGRVVWDKGFDMLVEAAGQMLGDDAAPAWVIAGEGDMRPELEARARQLGLRIATELPGGHAADPWRPRTLYLPGIVRGQEKQRLYRRSWIVAFPTRPEFGESFGMVLLEAMASGRAVVASDLPIVRELIEPGRNGVVVPARDASAWAQAIRRLLDAPAEREQMQRRNLADAQRYDWSAIAEQMCAVYGAAAGERRVTAR